MSQPVRLTGRSLRRSSPSATNQRTGTTSNTPWVLRLVVGRVGAAVLAMAGASLLIWMLFPLAPGDPARLILAAQGVVEPTLGQVQEVRNDLGLDQSLLHQAAIWFNNFVHGDWGISWHTGKDVREELVSRLAPTLRLTVAALILSIALALPSGLIAARWRNRWPDHLQRTLAVITASLPSFLVGLLLIAWFAVGRGWGKVILDGSWADVAMPAFCLSFGLFDVWSRVWRGGLVAGVQSGYALAATAKGASQNRLLLQHAAPNAAIPLIQLVALSAGALLGGATIVETVFTWPGIGAFVVAAVLARDMPVVQAFTICATAVCVFTSMCADLLSYAVDPRLRSRRLAP